MQEKERPLEEKFAGGFADEVESGPARQTKTPLSEPTLDCRT
jgi:hypothetical protein